MTSPEASAAAATRVATHSSLNDSSALLLITDLPRGRETPRPRYAFPWLKRMNTIPPEASLERPSSLPPHLVIHHPGLGRSLGSERPAELGELAPDVQIHVPANAPLP